MQKLLSAVLNAFFWFWILVFAALLLLYLYDVSQDNFINRHELMSVAEVSTFLHSELPMGRTSLQDLTDYAQIENLNCRTPTPPSFQAIIVCYPDVTNPAFYGSNIFPLNLLDNAYDHIFPSALFIRFHFIDNTLQHIDVEFQRGFL